MRVGQGFDAHRFGGDRPLIVGGVKIDGAPGVIATSDGDVVVHALIDAMLGASALGDLGELFPSSEPEWSGASSIDVLLPAALGVLGEAGWSVSSVDCTVIAQSVRISPHRPKMRRVLAGKLELQTDQVSVKATTTDGMGFAGAGEGIAALVVAIIDRPPGG